VLPTVATTPEATPGITTTPAATQPPPNTPTPTIISGKYIDFALGYESICAIKSSDNTVDCWGKNSYGQSTPPANLGAVKLIARGFDYYCAIKTNDQVRCWGRNNNGQSTPPANLGAVKLIDTGYRHACAIKSSDNTVDCWGENDYGQSTPPANLGAVKLIAAGRGTYALTLTEDVQYWGEVFNGKYIFPITPNLITQISSGSLYTCVVYDNNQAHCSGRYVPTTAELGLVKTISTNFLHICVIKLDDSVQCWRENGNGQSTVPSDLGKVIKIDTNHTSTCVLLDNRNDIRCWGLDNYLTTKP